MSMYGIAREKGKDGFEVVKETVLQESSTLEGETT